ncbi:MAG TPA: two-component system regulatory protein YycI [Bacillota bacterium]|nr:two-component system regulatory protein YycI [Bacillota bacterium]
MDWAKAKTILIVVFTAINIFLGCMIFGAGTGGFGYVDSGKAKQITDYLAEKDITVTGRIPGKKTDMPSIIVKYKLFSNEDVKGSFFPPGNVPEESASEHTVRLKGKNIEIRIKNNRELYYSDSGIKPAGAIDEKACRRNIREFLSKLNITDDIDAGISEDIEGYKRFVFSQSFKGAEIYNSIMEFYVNDSGVHRARIVWFETIRPAGKKTEVISPLIALLYVPEHNKNSELPSKEVVEIRQGYYFGTGARGQVDVSEVVEGTAFPVWKIETDRDIIYINAYNEKVEGIEKRQ